MRIAFSGTHGVGKSTLAVWLAEHLGVPYVPEYARELLEAGQDTSTLLGIVDFEDKVIRMKLAEEARLESLGVQSYVADRTHMDCVAYLKYGLAHYTQTEVEEAVFGGKPVWDYYREYRKICWDNDYRWDLIIFVLPFTEELGHEDDHRNKNPFMAEIIQDIIYKDLRERYQDGRLVLMKMSDLAERKHFILDLLKDRMCDPIRMIRSSLKG